MRVMCSPLITASRPRRADRGGESLSREPACARPGPRGLDLTREKLSAATLKPLEAGADAGRGRTGCKTHVGPHFQVCKSKSDIVQQVGAIFLFFSFF